MCKKKKKISYKVQQENSHCKPAISHIKLREIQNNPLRNPSIIQLGDIQQGKLHTHSLWH